MEFIDISNTKLKFKNLVSGPAPVGRILNYIMLAGKNKLKHKNGSRSTDLTGNIGDAWCTEFMIGLDLVKFTNDNSDDDVKELMLTGKGEEIYSHITKQRMKFDEGNINNCRAQVEENGSALYDSFKKSFFSSIPFKNLIIYLSEEKKFRYNKEEFKDNYFAALKEFYEHEEYINNSRTASTGGNRVPSLIDLCKFFEICDENREYLFFDAKYFNDITTECIARKNNILNPDLSLTPEWFREKSILYVEQEEKAENQYEEFRSRFSPEQLSSYEGLDLLRKLFTNDTNTDYMYNLLEHRPEYFKFGKARAGNNDYYDVSYKKKQNTWRTKDDGNVSEEKAIEVGEKHRDILIECTKIIEENRNKLNTIDDFVKMDLKIRDFIENISTEQMVYKYFHMIYPDVYPPYYKSDWLKKVVNVLGKEVKNSKSENYAIISLFIKECNISSFVFSRILGDYVFNKDNNNSEDDIMENKINYNNYVSGNAINLVIYGTPGCGKSFELNKRIKNAYKISDENIIRTTFYHDYSNTDFIGQIIPYVDSEGNATYKQNPGPFTKALCKAYNSKEDIALVIEELNRGDAPSIFGDIFQLLDRFKDEGSESYHKIGVSEYAIENSFIQQYLKEKTEYLFNDIRIPSNLYIFATMNTSDQNVFTLDTAFKRRWNFEKMTNDYDNYDKKLYVPGIDKTWIAFVKTLNKTMLELNGQINEDKQFGLYFVDKALLRRREDVPDENKIKNFAYKVFEYLWDDVVRFDRDSLFNNKFKTLDDLIDEYIKLAKDNEGMKVFNTDNLKEVND